MWVIAQTFEREQIARVCLENLAANVPDGAELHIWDDHSLEMDADWVARYGVFHREKEHYGIDRLRAVQLEKAWEAGVEEVYLTDSDALHDPGWYPAAKRLYQYGSPVSLYNTRWHENGKISCGNGYSMRAHAPGISMYLRRRDLGKIIGQGLDNWDWRLCDLLGNRCPTSEVSYVDHLGAGGIHSGAYEWQRDVAESPTPYLRELRKQILGELRGNSMREQIENLSGNGLTAVINQPRGMGDILFVEPLARWLAGLGYQVKWIVDAQFLGIARHIPYVQFIDRELLRYEAFDGKELRVIGNLLVLPLRWADQIEGGTYERCMRAKYDMLGMDWTIWRTAKWERDPAAEARLEKILRLPRKFALVNRKFRSDRSGTVEIPPISLPIVEMRTVGNYTLIDWAGVVEKAAEIHSVGTSLQYLVELINTKARLFMYPRKPDENDCRNYDYLFEKPWKKQE